MSLRFLIWCLNHFLLGFIAGTYGLVAILNGTAKEISTNATTTLATLLDQDSEGSGDDGFLDDGGLSINETFVDCTMGQSNATHIGPKVTNLSDIPAKEIFIVIMMLGLWVYSIILTRKAWYRILKEWTLILKTTLPTSIFSTLTSNIDSFPCCALLVNQWYHRKYCPSWLVLLHIHYTKRYFYVLISTSQNFYLLFCSYCRERLELDIICDVKRIYKL